MKPFQISPQNALLNKEDEILRTVIASNTVAKSKASGWNTSTPEGLLEIAIYLDMGIQSKIRMRKQSITMSQNPEC